jgi:hypothetical protein
MGGHSNIQRDKEIPLRVTMGLGFLTFLGGSEYFIQHLGSGKSSLAFVQAAGITEMTLSRPERI